MAEEKENRFVELYKHEIEKNKEIKQKIHEDGEIEMEMLYEINPKDLR